MTESVEMVTPASSDEWRVGWRIVLGGALAMGTGISLMFFTFSMFLIGIADELHLSRGQLGMVQALVVTAAIGSPLIGRLTDLIGFKRVFYVSSACVVVVQLAAALFGSTLLHLAITVALVGFLGVGTGPVAVTRPVNQHFVRHRGKALGLVAVGVSLTTMIVPPLLQIVIDGYGWRGGFIALAAASAMVGIPAVALLLPPDRPRPNPAGMDRQPHRAADWRFLRDPGFWLLVLALQLLNLASAGSISQMAPMIQEEGLSANAAAWALSLYAAGQFIGRIGCGWLLDRFPANQVAFWTTLVPGAGFVVLLLTGGFAPAALLAALAIGLQQGAEIDIFAYYAARKYDVSRYGTIYGALIGLGWVGNAAGIIGFSSLHDRFGSYQPAQLAAAVVLALGAVTLLALRLPPVQPQRV